MQPDELCLSSYSSIKYRLTASTKCAFFSNISICGLFEKPSKIVVLLQYYVEAVNFTGKLFIVDSIIEAQRALEGRRQ